MRHHSHVTGFGGICVDSLFHLWTEVVSFALCKHLYFFGTMSKRKILSYFQCETDKLVNKAEEKIEKMNFTRRKMTLDFKFET